MKGATADPWVKKMRAPKHEHEDDRSQPPFLPHLEKTPKFTHESNRRVTHSILSSSGSYDFDHRSAFVDRVF